MPRSTWKLLKDKTHEAWDTIPEDDKAIILGYAKSNQANSSDSSETRTAKNHEVEDNDLIFEDEPTGNASISVGVHKTKVGQGNKKSTASVSVSELASTSEQASSEKLARSDYTPTDILDMYEDHIKFKCLVDGNKEEVVCYNDICNFIGARPHMGRHLEVPEDTQP